MRLTYDSLRISSHPLLINFLMTTPRTNKKALMKVPTREIQKGGPLVSQIFEFPILTHLREQVIA